MNFFSKITMLICMIILPNALLQAQRASIGTTIPDPSSVFELRSTNQGVLIPRMSETDRDLINLPADGLMVYNSTQRRIGVFNSVLQEWVEPMADYELDVVQNSILVNTFNLGFLSTDHTFLTESISYLAFTPPSNSTEMYNNTLTGRWVLQNNLLEAPLIIPEGAYVSHIHLYFYDNSIASNCTFQVARVYNTTNASPSVLATYSSSGSSVQIESAQVLGPTGFTIESDHSYFLSFSNGNDSNVRIRGLQVTYRRPVHDQ